MGKTNNNDAICSKSYVNKSNGSKTNGAEASGTEADENIIQVTLSVIQKTFSVVLLLVDG